MRRSSPRPGRSSSTPATTGALIESEPHYFGGSSNVHTEDIDYEEVRKTFSTPEGARAFVEATGIDTFAAAVGNLHGRYPVPKQLDLELLRESATPSTEHQPARRQRDAGPLLPVGGRIGVSKVNLNSDMRYAYRTTLERQLADHPEEYAIVRLMGPVIRAVQDVVEEHIDLYGSAGRALT